MKTFPAFVLAAATLLLWTDVGVCQKPGSSKSSGSGSFIKLIDVKRHAVAGQWKQQPGGLVTNAEQGSRIALPVQPTGDYDFRVSFTRRTGRHSIALIFVAGGKQATFEIDAWGENLAGFQNIDGRAIRDNASRVTDQALTNGRRYTVELRVRRDRVDALLNGKVLSTYRGDGSNLSMLDIWRIPDRKSLGIGVWDSETVFHEIAVRRPNGGATLAAVSNPEPTSPNSPRPPTRPSRNIGGNSTATGRVLIVIATEGFFYREYGDPRQELEKAGFTVDVAAARKTPCRPHANSGQGSDGGIVRPDLAISDVDSKRYDAILFSGGWGSSMYQYAFQGSYSNRAYNGDRRTKETANRLINEFVASGKFVCGLCHGVSVLAWSRINGKSLLDGKRATGPTRQGPAGIYNGRQAQPASRWNSEVNNARMVTPNSVGNPRTAADDIVIDGRIMTGQDDISAREMGRQLALQLKAAGKQ